MDALINALTLTGNGAGQLAAHLLDWKAGTGVLMLIGLVWMARLEVDDVDARAAKPVVMRH